MAHTIVNKKSLFKFRGFVGHQKIILSLTKEVDTVALSKMFKPDVAEALKERPDVAEPGDWAAKLNPVFPAAFLFNKKMLKTLGIYHF